MSQARNALKSNNFGSTQARYDEYEIQSISLFEGISDLTSNELSFYKKLNEYLPTLQDKKESIANNKEKLAQLIKDYNLLLVAWNTNENEMKNTNIEISLEIDLIWRVHQLFTANYHKDCMKQFGKVINYKYRNINYNNSPLHINSTSFRNILNSVIDTNNNDINFISIDMNKFQSMLIYYCLYISQFDKYSLYHIDANKTIIRYRYFMYLKYIAHDNNANMSLIPTSDILLLWHCHIIYNISNYFDFSFQLFSNDFLDADFILYNKTITNNDIQQTQSLWDSYFGQNSFRDYAFVNFMFDDAILDANMHSAGNRLNEGAVNNNVYSEGDVGGLNIGDKDFMNDYDDGGKKGFFYHRENRKCVLCLGVIGYEVIVLIICGVLYFNKVGLVLTLIVLFGATLAMLVFVCWISNRNCCHSDDEDMENARIEAQVNQYPDQYRYA